MQTYQCPVCAEVMAHDLALFLDHTNHHIIDVIRDNHPEWEADDGVCEKCMDYYKKELAGDN